MLVVAAIALAAICASAVPAAAQAVFQGRFTLPNEVRWQGLTFPAGDYTFKMYSVATPARITLTDSNGNAHFITALVADKSDPSQQSSLIVEHRGGSFVVSEMYLAQIGLRLRYRVPKAPKDEELAEGRVTAEHILVAMK